MKKIFICMITFVGILGLSASCGCDREKVEVAEEEAVVEEVEAAACDSVAVDTLVVESAE